LKEAIVRERFLKRIFKDKLIEDIFFLTTVTLAAGFFGYEKHLKNAEVIRFWLDWFCVFSWGFAAGINGFLRRSRFVLFQIIYWFVPQCIIFASEIKQNTVLAYGKKFAEIFVYSPLKVFKEVFGVTNFVAIIILILFCDLCFLSGFFVRKSLKKKKWYCKLREEIIAGSK
jgi:hypothetical protein